MTEYVDQAVRKIRADGISLRRVAAGRETEAVAELEDGTGLRGVDGILDVPSGDRLGFLACQVVGHKFDGRRMVQWDDEETPAIECFRCRLVRARRPTGASLEDTGAGDSAPVSTE